MKLLAFFLLLSFVTPVLAQNTTTYLEQKDIFYREGATDTYMTERCRLDIYYPAVHKNVPVVIWFHGGGLTGGGKSIPEELKKQHMIIIAANYRLSPKATNPAYIEDAAAAVAWTFRHATAFGGDTARIIVSGHSAGGYLAEMIGLDKQWLKPYAIDANRIAALFPFSGQAITHFTYARRKAYPIHARWLIPTPRCIMYVPMRRHSTCIPATVNWNCWAAMKRMLTWQE